jgi:long-subunit acyl-CoA synthetase (AMP-forming)
MKFENNISVQIPREKVKHLMGFGECHSIFSGAAPIKLSTLKFFSQLDIQVLECFGMTESSGIYLRVFK